MPILKIILLIVGEISLLLASVCFLLFYLLEHVSSQTEETIARLYKTKHRKNVTIYGSTFRSSLPRPVMFLKYYSKGVYRYTVNGKTYKIRESHYDKPSQQPLILQVVYLRRLPWISYPAESTPAQFFYAIALTAFGILTILYGLSITC